MPIQDWQTWAALGVVALTLGLFGWRLIRARRKAGAGCGGGCHCEVKGKARPRAPEPAPPR